MVYPKAFFVEGAAGGGEGCGVGAGDCVCSEGAGLEGVGDAFAGEGLDDAGGIADDIEAGAGNGGDGFPRKWSDGVPGGGIGVEHEGVFGPGAKGTEAGWGGDDANIGEAIADGGEAHVAALEEAEENGGGVFVAGKVGVGAKADAADSHGGCDAEEAADGGITAVCGDEGFREVGAVGGVHDPY